MEAAEQSSGAKENESKRSKRWREPVASNKIVIVCNQQKWLVSDQNEKYIVPHQNAHQIFFQHPFMGVGKACTKAQSKGRRWWPKKGHHGRWSMMVVSFFGQSWFVCCQRRSCEQDSCTFLHDPFISGTYFFGVLIFSNDRARSGRCVPISTWILVMLV